MYRGDSVDSLWFASPLGFQGASPLMADIKSPTLLYAKGGMMLVVGILASAVLLLRHPKATTALLLAVAVWGFCRAYYFAFYVIDHYVDPGSRYAGLIAFARERLERRRKR